MGYDGDVRVHYLHYLVAPPACVLATALAGACNPDVSLSCQQLTSQAQVAIGFDQSEAGADRSCTSASDCVVVVTSSACLPSCSVVLTRAGAAKLQGDIAQINANVCSTFASDECPANPAPSCSSLVPVCMNGACTVADAGED